MFGAITPYALTVHILGTSGPVFQFLHHCLKFWDSPFLLGTASIPLSIVVSLARGWWFLATNLSLIVSIHSLSLYILIHPFVSNHFVHFSSCSLIYFFHHSILFYCFWQWIVATSYSGPSSSWTEGGNGTIRLGIKEVQQGSKRELWKIGWSRLCPGRLRWNVVSLIHKVMTKGPKCW